MNDYIEPSAFEQAGGVEDWRVLSDGACAFFPTTSFAESARLVKAIGAIGGIEEHPPAIDVRAGGVTARLVTNSPDVFGVTPRDLEVARRISEVARGLGLVADPSRLQSFLLIPGAPVPAEVLPFWRAALGYEPRPDSPDEDLVDPADRGPAFWFEATQQPRADGQGAIHVAVWLPPEQVAARVAAALAAGGRLVRDDFAPAWWTLADAAGNEIDISTSHHRGDLDGLST